MTSSDNQQYVTVEMFNNGIEGLKLYIDGRLVQMEKNIDDLKAEVVAMDKAVALNSAKIDMLQHYQSLGFTIMAIVIAFVGFAVALAPIFRDMYRESRKSKELAEKSSEHERDIHSLREEIARLKAGQ